MFATDTITFNGLSNSNKEIETVNDETSADQIESVTNNLTINLENECEQGCTKEIQTKTSNNSSIYVSSQEIKLDNKQIYKIKDGNYAESFKQVTVYNDIIITFIQESLSSQMIIFDFNANELKNITIFDDEQNRKFAIYPRYSQTEFFNVTNDGIISFVGTKHTQGEANTYILDTGNTVNLCNENISDDSIVSGIFKMTYTGNNSFSDITYSSTKTTVKDIKNCV